MPLILLCVDVAVDFSVNRMYIERVNSANLQINPQTGFLEAPTKKINSFDADKKLQLIQLITEIADQGKWPGIHKLCRSIGVAPSAFYEHLEVDTEFKAAYEEALLALEDHCVDNLIRQGNSANGVTANIFLLKNRWGKRWNENYQIQLNGHDGQIKNLIDRNRGFIDADIVDNRPLTSTPLEINTNQLTKVANTEPPSENK
jgi:hypothetical protein